MTLDQRFKTFLDQSPTVPASAYVAPQATLIGAVHLGENASVWPACVLRGDINSIHVGDRSNVQDGTIIHLADDYPVRIGNDVTIGHGSIIHACQIENDCLIGMGATVMDGAVIGHHSIVGAGALVTPNTQIPPGSMVMGAPAMVTRALSAEEQAKIRTWAAKYVAVSAAHKAREAQ